MKATKNKLNDAVVQNGTDVKNKQNENTSNTNDRVEDGHINKKRRIMQKITYEDLDNSSENKRTGTQLNLSKVNL